MAVSVALSPAATAAEEAARVVTPVVVAQAAEAVLREVKKPERTGRAAEAEEEAARVLVATEVLAVA